MPRDRIFGRTEWLLLLTIILLTLLSLSIRSAWAVDQQRMQRDLDVAESVLRSLCEHQQKTPHSWGEDIQVRGLHLEGYGALLLIEGCLSRPQQQHVFVVNQSGADVRNVVTTVKSVGKDDAEKEEKPATTEKLLEGAREMVVEFLGNYGDAIGQLAPDDRITVLVSPTGGHGLALPLPPLPPVPPLPVDIDADIDVDALDDRVVEEMDQIADQLEESGVISDSLAERIRWKVRKRERMSSSGEGEEREYGVRIAMDVETPEPLPLLAATVKKADLTAHRQGKIDDAQLRARIPFKEHAPDDPAMKTVDIMAGILDKALDGGRWSGFRLEEGTRGIYQPELGALFFVEAQPRGYGFTVGTFTPRKEPDREAQKQLYAQIEDQLVETIADYGATLRPLKAGEYLVVEVRFPRLIDFSSAAHPSRLILKAGKAQIDAYRSGELSLEQFRKKIEIQEL